MAEPPPRIVVKISSEHIPCLGVDTPISLSSPVRQCCFKEITDLKLKRLLCMVNPVVLTETKNFLGQGHLDTKEFYRDNTQISSRFVASVLDAGLSEAITSALASELFEPELLGGLDKVLYYALLVSSVPRPADIEGTHGEGASVTYYPLLLDLKGPDRREHRQNVSAVVDYLKWRILPNQPGDQNKEDFKDYATLNGFLLEEEPIDPPPPRGDPQVAFSNASESV